MNKRLATALLSLFLLLFENSYIMTSSVLIAFIQKDGGSLYSHKFPKEFLTPLWARLAIKHDGLLSVFHTTSRFLTLPEIKTVLKMDLLKFNIMHPKFKDEALYLWVLKELEHTHNQEYIFSEIYKKLN